MELLLILTYTAICYLAFKVFRIPLNKWTIPTAALGGIFLLGLILLMMNYNHPFTSEARFYFFTTPMAPYVKGVVLEVPIKSNTPLKKGDVLYRLDPRPYEAVVMQKKAALAEAEQNVKQLRATYDQAAADVERAKAQVALAQQNFDRQDYLFKTKVVAKATLDTASRNLEVATQSLEATTAAADRARLGADAQIGGVNTTVARLQGDLLGAEYELEQATQRAPTDGYVAQLLLHPGMILITTPSKPVMVFVHAEGKVFAAAFQQNALQRVRIGDEAEIAFDAVPGRIFKGRIGAVSDAVAQGQLMPTGELINPEDRHRAGRALAYIEIVDDLSPFNLPGGAVGQVAAYTEHWQMFAIIRRILLRMKSWLNYVFTDGH
jgi:multidrug resistance efflux pump